MKVYGGLVLNLHAYESWSLSCPAYNLVTIPTELFQFFNLRLISVAKSQIAAESHIQQDTQS